MDGRQDNLVELCLKLIQAQGGLAKATKELSEFKCGRVSSLALRILTAYLRLKTLFRRLLGGELSSRRLLKRARKLPKSNGSRFYVKRQVKIGIVCDPFMWGTLAPAADFVFIHPTEDGFRTLKKVDCLLVVSTYFGLRDEEWRDCSDQASPQFAVLLEMMDRVRASGRPVVFYSKEDPVSYSQFLPQARRADVVFTTAVECVGDYRRDCGHDRVFPLAFCINPLLHNPVGSCSAKRRRGVLFAGSWWKQFPARCQELTRLLKGVLDADFPLLILNRHMRVIGDGRGRFPDEFVKFVRPAVAHDELQLVHKLFDWAVNINTVTGSETMFAVRVRELLASGTLLISNPSKGMELRFPEVFVAEDEETVRQTLMSEDTQALQERRRSGIRRVMTGETCFDRVDELLAKVALERLPLVRRILVVCDRVTPQVKNDFERQTYPHRKLAVRTELTEEEYLQADMVAFFADGGSYPDHYLEDLSNAFKYTDVDFITDGAGKVQDYVDGVTEVSRTLFWRESLPFAALETVKGVTFAAGGYCV